MTLVSDFVARLTTLDVRLWLDGGQLRCSAPNQVLTPALRAELADRKTEIVLFLRQAKEGADEAIPRAVIADTKGGFPLSRGQERLWPLVKRTAESDVYHVNCAFRLAGELNVVALERSLNGIQNRHPALRTVIRTVDRQPMQIVLPESRISLPVTDCREGEAVRLVQAESSRPFDLDTGPLWRCQLLRLSGEDFILAFTMHHLIFDGSSKDLFLDELCARYAAWSKGTPPQPARLPIDYVDFSTWQRSERQSEDANRQLTYWRGQLSGCKELRLPADHPRDDRASDPCASHAFQFTTDLSRRLAERARGENASLFHVLLAAFATLMHRHVEQEDQVICCPVACRNHPDVERLIGYFNNLVVVRTDLSGDPSLRQLIERARRAAFEADRHQDIPFQSVAGLPELTRVRLTRAMLSFRSEPCRLLELPGLESTPVTVRKQTADFDLALYLDSIGDRVGGVFEYNARLFEPDTVSGLVTRFESVLEDFADRPAQRLSEVASFAEATASDVQSLLDSRPQVEEAVVVDRHGETGRCRMAYIVPNQHDIPSVEDLRSFLRERLPEYLVPVAFVPIESIPRNARGHVDDERLPLPSGAGRSPQLHYVPPRTPLETTLAAIWKRVLWSNDEIGVHDDFFAQGGHSLLSVQLVATVESELECELPTEVLGQITTIAEMAAAIEAESEGWVSSPVIQESGVAPVAETARSPLPPDILRGLLAHVAAWQGSRTRRDSLVFGQNTDGKRQPLFWCCQGFHELKQLARHLGSDQPVYGMRSGHRVMVKTRENIATLAAHYVNDILEVQPQGPYLVGGNCQAAQIAFQIAQQLTDCGHEITLLCLQEQFIREPYAGRVAFFFGDRSDKSPYLKFANPEAGWRKFYAGHGFSVYEIQGEHSHFFDEPNVQVLAAKLDQAIGSAQRSEPVESPGRGDEQFQVLSENAYRATIAAERSLVVAAGNRLVVPVNVRNDGSGVWSDSGRSGLVLANRWLDRRGNVVQQLDGTAVLDRGVGPGESIDLQLEITVPATAGRYQLELDMVDEGVVWFQDKGSTAARVKVTALPKFLAWTGQRKRAVA